MKIKIFYLLFLISLAVACKPTKTDVVYADVSSFKKPILVSSNTPFYLDEIEYSTTESKKITLTVTNQSPSVLKKLSLAIPTGQNIFKFLKDEDDFRKSPGFGGTCIGDLAPGQSCTFVVELIPAKKGDFNISLTINYLNLVEKASHDVAYNGFIGEEAELIFENYISKFSLGMVEQSRTDVQEFEMTIQNIGELTAREIGTTLVNELSDPAFTLIKDTCSPRLKGKSSCKLTIGYRPYNNAGTDPNMTYNGTMTLDYLKDPIGESGKIAGGMNFLSMRLEGEFQLNTTAITFSGGVVGNQATKTFNIKNVGYYDAIPQVLYFGAVKCIKEVGTFLNCYDGTTLLDLNAFPFLVEDLGGCFNQRVAGLNNASASNQCTIKLTYWPNSSYTNGFNFPLTNINLEYDSLWKKMTGEIKTVQVGRISAITTLGVAQLTFNKAELILAGDIKLPNALPEVSDPNIVKIGGYISPGVLGKVPMFNSNVNTATTYHTLKLHYKNTGKSPASIKKLFHKINSTTDFLTPSTLTKNTGFYTTINVPSACNSIAVNAFCIITMRLVPKDMSDPTTEDGMMWDTYDPLGLADNFKSFSFTYTNGAKYDSSNNLQAELIKNLNVVSKLGRQGILSVISPAAINYIGIAGQSAEYTVRLLNKGSGPLSFSETGQNLNPPSTVLPAQLKAWSTKFINSGAADDCLLFGVGGVYKTLAANQECTLKAQVKLSEAYVRHTSNANDFSSIYELHRTFDTNGIYNLQSNPAIQTLSFVYRPDPLDTTYTEKSNSFTVKSSFNSEANMAPYKVFPKTAAIIFRPQINYLAKSDTYPTAFNVVAHNSGARKYFDSTGLPYDNALARVPVGCPGTDAGILMTTHEGCWNKVFNPVPSFQYWNSLAITPPADTYAIHIGTFPIGVNVPVRLQFTNGGQSAAKNFELTSDTTDAATPEFKNNNNTVQPASLGYAGLTSDVAFTFKSNVEGTFSRCYTLKYNSLLRDRTTKFCLYGGAVDTFSGANSIVSISYKNDTGTYTDITSPVDAIDNSKSADFYLINDPNETPKPTIRKRFKITNNSSAIDMTNLNVLIIKSADATTTSLTNKLLTDKIDLITSAASMVPALGAGENACTTTLLRGASCYLDILYRPTFTEGPFQYYLGTYFEIKPKQFVVYNGSIRFRNMDPVTLTVVNNSFSDPLTPTAIDLTPLKEEYNPLSTPTPNLLEMIKKPIRKSYGISINSNPLSPDKTPYVLLNRDVGSYFQFRVVNGSSLKTSFMPAWRAFHPEITNSAQAEAYFNTNLDTYHQVLSIDKLKTDVGYAYKANVYVNRYCLFGDDEGKPSLGFDYRGFNNGSQNICRMKVEFFGERTFSGANCEIQKMGMTIGNGCNPYSYQLKYNTTDGVDLVPKDFNFHMTGFMQPNGVTPTIGDLDGVKIDSGGVLEVKVPDIQAINSNRGQIVTGVICYDVDYLKLKYTNMYNLFEAFNYSGGVLSRNNTSVDIDDCQAFSTSDEYIRVAGLMQGDYYFFRIYAMRFLPQELDYEQDLSYLSMSTMNTLTVPVPFEGTSYSHELKVLIDNSYQDGFKYRPGAIDACRDENFTVRINGNQYRIPKFLINTTIFNYITENPNISSDYPTLGVGSVAHWLSDSPYDVSSSISLYDGTAVAGFPNYNPSDMSGFNLLYKAAYSKTCTGNDSCNFLYKMAGGDPEDGLFYEGVLYTGENSAVGAVRCYKEILCPTNANYPVSSVSCVQP